MEYLHEILHNRKNLFFFVLLFILLSSPKKVYASDILASADTILQLSNGANNLTNAGYTSFGYFPIPLSSQKQYDPIAEKLNVNTSDMLEVSSDDITISSLSNDDILSLNDPIYNSLGQEMDLNNVFKGLFDNGFFTGYFFCDSNGDVLYYDQDATIALMDIKHGGNVVSSNDWTNAYTSLGNDLLSNSYLFGLNNTTVTNTSFYLCWGQWQGGQPRNIWSLFINDQYSIGNTVPYQPTQGQRIYRWVTNDLSNFNYKNFVGTDNSRYVVSNFNQNYNGYTYRYLVTFGQSSDFTNFSPNNTIANWLRGYNTDSNLFGKINYTYNSSLLHNDQVAFKPLNLDETKSKIMIGESYGVTALDDYVDNVGSITGVYNPSYNGSNSISSSNYPLIYDISIDAPSAVVPDTTVLSPSLTYDPAIQFDFSTGIESFQNLQIPFISGLNNRYPFSIPWDIANFIRRFSSEPTPPAWNFDWDITVGNTTYTKHFEGDLSDFNELAEIFRNLVLISFIIALCKFSYDHHF